MKKEENMTRVEQIRVPTEDMKKIMIGHIDNLSDKDFVNFQIGFTKLPKKKEFTKSFSIEVDKDVQMCDGNCEQCGGGE